MHSHEVLRQAIDIIGVKALAAELRLSPALIYKWCEEADQADPDSSVALNPLDRLRDIIRLTKDTSIASWICNQAGGFFVHNPIADSKNIDADLLQSTQHMVNDFSNLLDEVSRSVADDGAIEGKEAERIRKDWERLKTTAESFVVACERGKYKRKQK